MSLAMRHATSAFSGCSASRVFHPGAVPAAYGPEHLGQPRERLPRHVGDVEPRELHRQRLRPEPLAPALGTLGAHQEPRHPLLHERALGLGERLEHVPPGARERAHVARLFLALERAPRLRRGVAGVDRNRRRLLGIEDPVAVLPGQLAPRAVHVVAQRHQDVAQVLPMPRRWPRGDRPLADRARIVGDHAALGHVVDPAQPVAAGTRPLGRVGRERLRVEQRPAAGVVTGAGVEHPEQVRERRDASDRGPRGRRAPLLLERHRGREPVDRVHLGHADLVEEAAGVGCHALEVAALCLGVEGAEGQGRFARAGDAGEHHQRVPRDADVDALEVRDPGAADVDIAVRGPGRWRGSAARHVRRLPRRRASHLHSQELTS
jgi:hypothetical protein